MYFKSKAKKSLLEDINQKHKSLVAATKDPYAPTTSGMKQPTLIERDSDSDDSNQIGGLSPGRSHSVIQMDESYFFHNNLVLKSDLREKLGEKTSQEMARASKRGFSQARCISEL